MIFSTLYLLFATDIKIIDENSFSARTFPYILGSIGIIVSFLLVVLPSPKETLSSLLKIKWISVLYTCMVMLIYAFLLPRIGFIFATILFLNICFLIMGEKKWRRMFYTSFSLTCVFWVLLTQVLSVYLAPGSWWMG